MKGRAERYAWRLRRALAMSPAEVGLRAARGLRRRLTRPRRPKPQASFAVPERVVEGAVDPDDACRRVRDSLSASRCSLIVGGRDPDALKRGLESIGIDRRAIVSTAEAVLSGTIVGFGWASFDVGAEPDWHRDPVTGERWDLDFWADMNLHGDGTPAEPRFCWEVNRHHHLVTLARAYALTGDLRFAAAVWREITSWIDANPPLFGINWSSPLEIALRLISWCMALDLVGVAGAGEWDPGVLAVSAALQAQHVHDNLTSYASSRNNHLIGEAAGLVVTGAKLAFLTGSDRWADTGAALLNIEVPAQVTADGVSREQTLHYGAFVLELCLAGLAGARALDRPLRREFVQAVERMADFLISAGGPGGVPPSVGDDDGGRVLGLSDQALDRQPTRAALAARAMLAGPAPPPLRHADLEPAVWLAPHGAASPGGSGGRGDDARGRQRGGRAFEDGGYFVLGNGEHHGVADCGPLGYLSTAAHGHADCLSVALWCRGRWLVVDPGTYCYHADPALRNHFRSTRAHNTVLVDGVDQSEMLGPFLWGRRARPSPRAWALCPRWQYFEGEHDGYAGRGVTHRRSIVFVEEGYWIVIDFLLGSGRHELAATFQLGEGMRVRGEGERTFVDDDGRSVRIEAWLPEGFVTEVVEGREDPPTGWVSPGFGRRLPASALVARGAASLPAVLVFAVVPTGAGPAPDVSCRSGPDPSGVEVLVTVADGSDRLMFSNAGRGDADRFEGRFGFVRARGGEREAWGLDVSRWTGAAGGVDFTPVENLLRGRERSGFAR